MPPTYIFQTIDSKIWISIINKNNINENTRKTSHKDNSPLCHKKGTNHQIWWFLPILWSRYHEASGIIWRWAGGKHPLLQRLWRMDETPSKKSNSRLLQEPIPPNYSQPFIQTISKVRPRSKLQNHWSHMLLQKCLLRELWMLVHTCQQNWSDSRFLRILQRKAWRTFEQKL